MCTINLGLHLTDSASSINDYPVDFFATHYPHQSYCNIVPSVNVTLIDGKIHHSWNLALWHWNGWNPNAKVSGWCITTRTAALSGITTRTATLLWSKRPHCFGQNGHIGWVATKTATLFLVKTATLFWSKQPQGGLYLNEQKWLPKRPHCIWSKRPQIVSDINFVKSEYLNAFAWHPKTSTISLC